MTHKALVESYQIFSIYLKSISREGLHKVYAPLPGIYGMKQLKRKSTPSWKEGEGTCPKDFWGGARDFSDQASKPNNQFIIDLR